MNLKEIKYLIGEWGKYLFGPVCAGLVVISSFCLGMLETHYLLKQDSPYTSNLVIKSNPLIIYRDRCEGEENRFVASQNGSKYYPIGCSYASRIKEENRIMFKSEEEAIEAGYERSVQCK